MDLLNAIRHAREDVDVSLRIARIPFICCASPGYLQSVGVPATPEALREHRCLVFRYPVDGRFLRYATGCASRQSLAVY